MSVGKMRLQWYDVGPLTNGETRVLEAGGASGVSGLTWHICDECDFLTFSVLASHDCALTIRGAFDDTFADVIDLGPFAITGAAVFTPYNLPAPYASAGGWLPVHMPYIRLILADSAAANHTSLLFYARVW